MLWKVLCPASEALTQYPGDFSGWTSWRAAKQTLPRSHDSKTGLAGMQNCFSLLWKHFLASGNTARQHHQGGQERGKRGVKCQGVEWARSWRTSIATQSRARRTWPEKGIRPSRSLMRGPASLPPEGSAGKTPPHEASAAVPCQLTETQGLAKNNPKWGSSLLT